jgi:hypothetical protein
VRPVRDAYVGSETRVGLVSAKCITLFLTAEIFWRGFITVF